MTWIHAYREVEEATGVRYTRAQLLRGFRRFIQEGNQAQQAA
jgi:hypothetical protein